MNHEKNLYTAELDWVRQTQNHPILNVSCTLQELDEEFKWVEALLTCILNTHCKKMQVTPFSKRWWNKEIAKARKAYAREKKLWDKTISDREKLKQARNTFYHTIQRVKRECWQKFLMGEK